MGGSGDYSNIVGMSGSNGVMDGVSSISVSKSGVSMDSRGSNNTRVSVGSWSSNNLVSITKMSNTSVSNMSSIGTVANCTESADNTIRIVNTSYNTTVGESSGDLSNSVGISLSLSLSFDSGHAQK